MPGKPLSRDPERYAALKALVESGGSLRRIRRELGIDPRTVKRYFPDAGRDDLRGGQDLRATPERYSRLEEMVRQEVPLSEIMRTLKIDHRTVHRAFPGYKVMERGEGNHIRAMNQMLQKIDKYGTVDNTNNGR